MRIARDLGGVSTLLPRERNDLLDVPHLFFEAIRFALIILSFDELPSEDRPPKRIWRDGERLTRWFDDVKRHRDDEAKGYSRHIEDPVQNEAAQALIVDG